MELKPGERVDVVNDKLNLIQNSEGLTFGTDALLLAGYINGSYGKACELGGGTGIISMLLLTRSKAKSAVAIEIQEEYAELVKRNAEFNSLSDRLESVCSDVREYKPGYEFDLVFTNPPYMKTDTGRANLSSKKNIARHEVFGGINDFCRAGARLLKYGGTFAAVYRTDRLCDLMTAMRECGIEAKRMTLVHADTESQPSIVLIEGKRGGKCGLKLTRPLYIYKDKTHTEYSEDMNYIMESGCFGKDFTL